MNEHLVSSNILDLKRTVIYVQVLKEGVDVWRPVEAVINGSLLLRHSKLRFEAIKNGMMVAILNSRLKFKIELML